MYQVLRVGEDDISDQHWQGYFELLKELKARYQTPYSLVSWESTRNRALSRLKEEKGNQRAIILEDGKHVAFAGLAGRNVGTPQQTAFFVFDLLDDHVSPDLERVIVEQIDGWMDQFGLDESFGVANDAHREKVVRHWGAQELSRLDEYALERKAVNEAAVESWLNTIPACNPDLKLEFYQMLPDEYVEPFAELLKETLRAMPEEAEGGIPFHDTVQNENEAEERRRNNGMTAYKYLLFDAQDDMIAMTIVDIDLDNPLNVFQLMTGITRKYRGHGLGKWLKAAMFRKLGEDFPANERITTSMRSLNKPMQAINARMGFELVRRGYEFKLTRETIETYLRKR